MIELSSTAAFTLYLGLTLGFILSIWVIHHLRGKRKKISLLDQELFVCEYCNCAYLATRGLEVTQCPQCNCYNKPIQN